jgi:hypothetical protein
MIKYYEMFYYVKLYCDCPWFWFRVNIESNVCLLVSVPEDKNIVECFITCNYISTVADFDFVLKLNVTFVC